MSDGAPERRRTFHFGRGAVPPAAPGEPSRRGRLRPWLWGAAYVLVTTLAFSPALSFRRGATTPGTIAARDVVAPRDLIVPDPEATARRRAEASAEVLPLYELDALAGTRFEEEIRR